MTNRTVLELLGEDFDMFVVSRRDDRAVLALCELVAERAREEMRERAALAVEAVDLRELTRDECASARSVRARASTVIRALPTRGGL
jgi:hypothetical protein